MLTDRAPRYSVVDTDFGTMYGAFRDTDDGRRYWRVANVLFPFWTNTTDWFGRFRLTANATRVGRSTVRPKLRAPGLQRHHDHPCWTPAADGGPRAGRAGADAARCGRPDAAPSPRAGSF